MQRFLLILIFILSSAQAAQVVPGVETLFTEEWQNKMKGRQIGLITNQTAVNRQLVSTLDLLKSNAKNYKLAALFAPEHGLTGQSHAAESIEDKELQGIPIHSLYGKTHRPTPAMLKGLDLLIFDIQDIGSRSYTYITTLFYVMEEAAKQGIEIWVLDRPNPINGVTIDGTMLQDKWRSIVGYINVPYCHGMTVGELARYFNTEYKIGAKLEVVPMKGWKRTMSFKDTGLTWVPTSPHIPEAETPLYYPMTGILGELSVVNIGIGYTLPFKLVGAPWMDAVKMAKEMNSQKFPGVYFKPFYFKPFYGKYKNENCEGVMIIVQDHLKYKPVSTLYLIIGTLKRLYPTQFSKSLKESLDRRNMFAKVNGTDEVYEMMSSNVPIIWKLRELHQKERGEFIAKRKKYLLY